MLKNFHRLLSLCFLFLLIQPITSQARQPNVVVVITDDQGYGDIGYHGNPEVQTPTLDALARSSLRLTNFHVDPTCAETRAALMTGQYPLRGGVWHTIMGRSILNKNSVTLPQLFRSAGYRTGMFGKWHLGDNYPYRPQDRGFDTTLHHGGGGVTQTPDVWGNDYFDDVYWSGDRLQPVRGYCTDVFFDAAKQFIQSEPNKPFFCYLATNAAHAPYNVPDAYQQPYLAQGIEKPRANFYGMITNIDDNLAKLLALLDQRGIAQDTIVIFMTDNGSAAGYGAAGQGKPAKGFNAGMRGLKGSPYDGGHRVPCFIRYPGKLPADKDFNALCAHVDILPTLARLCNLKVDGIPRLDGRDLVDYVQQTKPWSERTLVVQSHRVEEPVMWTKSAVMTERWRLINGQQLFDIQADPGQQAPLTGSEHQAVIKTLREAYEQWWQDMAVKPEQYAPIVLGAPAAQRVQLTAHDWHGPAPVWSQTAIEQDPVTNGFWSVEVARPGAYQFLLSRRPLDQPVPINATQAKVTIGNVSQQIATDPSVVLAPITLRLEPGTTRLQTELIASDGSSSGAYFVTVNYLGDVPQSVIDNAVDKNDQLAKHKLPNWLRAGDRVAWLGGTLVERAATSGALETEILLRAPHAGLTFVNLGWSGDDYTGRARAVFGSASDGKARRLADLRLSGASVVVIAYGMSELLDAGNGTKLTDHIKIYDTELREMVAAVQADGRRAVLCLPPELIDDIEGTAAQPLYSATSAAYQQHRPELVAWLTRVAQELQLPLLPLPSVKTSMFESGTYLSTSGYRSWSSSAADLLFADVPNVSVSSRTVEKDLYQLSSQCNRLFFDMHRPQNETYLLLFRKHEQGNNAVELGQYRALIAQRQLELIQAAAKAGHN